MAEETAKGGTLVRGKDGVFFKNAMEMVFTEVHLSPMERTVFNARSVYQSLRERQNQQRCRHKNWFVYNHACLKEHA
jgi:hypothetical protein